MSRDEETLELRRRVAVLEAEVSVLRHCQLVMELVPAMRMLTLDDDEGFAAGLALVAVDALERLGWTVSPPTR